MFSEFCFFIKMANLSQMLTSERNQSTERYSDRQERPPYQTSRAIMSYNDDDSITLAEPEKLVNQVEWSPSFVSKFYT